MALLAVQLGAVPLKEIVRGPTYAHGGGERLYALFAALLLVAESPTQADKREDHEAENLKEVGGVWQGSVNGLADICAQQKCEKQNLRYLYGEEEMSLDPVESVVRRALFDMPARCGGEGNEDDEGRCEKG